ncbi:MAG: M20 metallopeptidase family protein [Lysobacterales bacterium]
MNQMKELQDTGRLGALAGSPAFQAQLSKLRRWFHRHPELSFQEKETAARIMRELDALGIHYRYAGVGHAVIADIDGTDASGPFIALRADMDALPGEETTGTEYASRNPGVMHACGHCAHMAMLLGAARLLQANPPPGPVRLVFQPGEERGGGARTAIADGAIEGVRAIFAGHVTHEYETGQIMVKGGAVTAQSDGFRISISGQGGHGARPHEAVDAVVISSMLTLALQTLVSRESNPLHPAVITVGSLHSGSASNVIAETAEMAGSIRTNYEPVRQHLHNGIRRMAGAAGELHNAQVKVEIHEGYPPVYNERRATELARDTARQTVGEAQVAEAELPSMGSEDFAFYLQRIPGCFVRIGARKADWEPVPLHSPSFDIDEAALPVGAAWLDAVARRAHQQIDRFAHGGERRSPVSA